MGMSGIDTVLLPTDLSEEFDLMLRFAEGLPGSGVSRALVGHIVRDAGAPKAGAARARLEERVARLRDAGLPVDVRVADGEPTEALLQMAREENADAVIVGTHGKSVEERLSEGSVSAALAMGAHLPVALVRFDMLDGSGGVAEVASALGEMILVPTDFSASASRAQAFACRLAHTSGGIVRLLTVVSDGKRPTPALEDLRARCKAQGTRTSRVVRVGEPSDEILAESLACEATSVVMGTRGRSPAGEELLGSISMSVARSITCPLVIVP